MTSLRSAPQIPPQLGVGMGLPPRANAARPMSDEEVAQHVEHVVEHGYVFIPGYFSEDAVKAARECVEAELLPQLTGKVRPPTLHEPFCEWLESHLSGSAWLEPLRPVE